MATKIDQNAIRIAELYDIRLEIKRNSKENYTKEEILDFIDEIAARIKAEEE